MFQSMHFRPTLQRAAIFLACAGTSVSGWAALPSTLRALGDSYRALSMGTSTALAIELMGNPKTRIDSMVLGVSYAEMSWIDITLTRYQARFVADKLMHKSSASAE